MEYDARDLDGTFEIGPTVAIEGHWNDSFSFGEFAKQLASIQLGGAFTLGATVENLQTLQKCIAELVERQDEEEARQAAYESMATLSATIEVLGNAMLPSMQRMSDYFGDLCYDDINDYCVMCNSSRADYIAKAKLLQSAKAHNVPCIKPKHSTVNRRATIRCRNNC